MKTKPFALAGIALIVLGLAALIHPRFSTPVSQGMMQAGTQKVMMSARRIRTIPPFFTGIAILAGAGLIFISTREP